MHPLLKTGHKVESNYRECTFALGKDYERDNILTLDEKYRFLFNRWQAVYIQ